MHRGVPRPRPRVRPGRQQQIGGRRPESYGAGGRAGQVQRLPVPLGAAVDAALRAVPGTVTSIELDDAAARSGALHREVGITGKDGNRHGLNVGAKTTAVTADRPDGGRRGDDHGDD
ncbi:PepSY domain-containing protein [Streptomyces sp. NPDC051286]|uniref:PepSY domain-containing protein n=1 Tax=Streptomyces sp. NPDC051286 TaxID=3365647 RepID=UPI003794AD24